MNIFVIDNDIELCAQYHVDRHVVKMVLETTQLLNNARIKFSPNKVHIYKETHRNHPCSVWAATSSANFNWLNKLGLALCKEYTFRYGKIHKCEEIIRWFSETPSLVPEGEITPFAQCMPDQYKSDNVVESYRNYYRNEKRSIAVWTKRQTPEWWE